MDQRMQVEELEFHCTYSSFPGSPCGFTCRQEGRGVRFFIPTDGCVPSFGKEACNRVQEVIEEGTKATRVNIVFH